MKWKSALLIVFIVIVIGGSAAMLANLYFSQHPIVITEGGDAYNILRDVLTIVIAVLTLFTAILIVIVGWALRGILLHDLKEELEYTAEESKNTLCANLHSKLAPLWGRLFEYHKTPSLIEYAVGEARQALDYANKLDEKVYWDLKIGTINNLLMSLADKGDIGDTNEAYKLSTDLEKMLKKHEKEMEIHYRQRWEESICFTRARLPRSNTDDREKAISEFNALREHPSYKQMRQRWEDFGLITKGASLDKS